MAKLGKQIILNTSTADIHSKENLAKVFPAEFINAIDFPVASIDFKLSSSDPVIYTVTTVSGAEYEYNAGHQTYAMTKPPEPPWLSAGSLNYQVFPNSWSSSFEFKFDPQQWANITATLGGDIHSIPSGAVTFAPLPGPLPAEALPAATVATLGGDIELIEDTAPPPVSTVHIGGVQVTVEQATTARDCLSAAKGVAVKAPLAKIDHPLAGCDYHTVAAIETALDPTLTGIKAAFIRHLDRAITAAAAGVTHHPLLTYDADGYVKPVADAVIPHWANQYHDQVKKIAKAFGNGKIIGRGRTRMTHDEQLLWLRAWHRGDLAKAYQIEAKRAAKPHPLHPGAPGNPDTHMVIWQPAVAGELPAGIWPPGNWTSPAVEASYSEVSNYLIAAKMAHPRHLSSGHRRSWVRAHIKGDKVIVDALSQQARNFAAKYPDSFETDAPVWTDGLLPTVDFDALFFIKARDWPLETLRAYVTAHNLTPASRFWKDITAAVETHRQAAIDAKAIEDAQLKFSLDPDQPALSGYHRKALLLDQHGERWLFKAVPSQAHRFRAEVEHEAHVLARLWGYRTAESHLIEHDGVYGQAQRFFDVHTNLVGVDFTALSVEQLCALAREHVLDWALDNDDSHGENLIITTAGTLVGIDKGRAFRYFGGWDGLCGHEGANSNCALVYSDLYRAIKAHQLPADVTETMYRAVIAQARRMQRLPDDTLAQIITRAQANRPHFNPSSYQRVVPGTPTNVDELITAATARKNTLVADMQTLWGRIYTDAGWTLPDTSHAFCGVNTQGHPLHAGLHSPELHAAVAKTKSYGTATFVAGTQIEDAHILLWRERRPDGAFNIRGQFKARGTAYADMKIWCATHAVKVDIEPTPSRELPYESEAYDAIIAAAKTVSHHHQDGEYNSNKLYYLDAYATQLNHMLAKETPLVDQPDPYGVRAATIAMCQQYLGYVDTINQHKTNHTKSKIGDFPRYEFVPLTPQTAEPDPNAILVELRRATRAAAHLEDTVKLDDDGELTLDGSVLENTAHAQYGQYGLMYLITLPTGEQIEFRGDEDTETLRSCQGLTQFTIGDAEHLDESLHRIEAQLATMGLRITPADSDDLELYYWRHLAGILNARADSHRYTSVSPYKAFWQRVTDTDGLSRTQEVEMWRHAFAALTSPEQIEQFLAADAHLPRFMHMDLRNPTQPTGKPYWERFDVPDDAWHTKQMPISTYNSGASRVPLTGVVLATEARIRTLAIWKKGMSSAEDMDRGSGAFIFTRNNLQEAASGGSIWYSPRILRRTTNYSFNSDKYGATRSRNTYAYFDFEEMTSHTDGANEMMVKDALSLLDDIEIMVYDKPSLRTAAIGALKSVGITEIRGIHITRRLLMRDDHATRRAVFAQIRENYRNG